MNQFLLSVALLLASSHFLACGIPKGENQPKESTKSGKGLVARDLAFSAVRVDESETKTLRIDNEHEKAGRPR